MDIVYSLVDFFDPQLKWLSTHLEYYLTRLVSWSDPITVIITLLILLSPVALAYTCISRMAFVKVMQMDVSGKNILYVIAHPDDEAM